MEGRRLRDAPAWGGHFLLCLLPPEGPLRPACHASLIVGLPRRRLGPNGSLKLSLFGACHSVLNPMAGAGGSRP